jgi:hypothetical protein
VRPPRVSRTTPSHGRRAVSDHQLACPRTPNGIARLHFALGSGITSAFRHSRRDSPHRRESKIALHYEKEARVCVRTHARTRARARTAHIDPYVRIRVVAGADEASLKVEDRGPSGVVAGSTVDRRAKRANRLPDSFFAGCPRMRMRLRATLNTMHVAAIRSPSALEPVAHLYLQLSIVTTRSLIADH